MLQVLKHHSFGIICGVKIKVLYHLKGLVEEELEWILWMWCLAHRLQLAIKDALTGTFFDSLDEMPLSLYYLYQKSPKKCRELE